MAMNNIFVYLCTGSALPPTKLRAESLQVTRAVNIFYVVVSFVGDSTFFKVLSLYVVTAGYNISNITLNPHHSLH